MLDLDTLSLQPGSFVDPDLQEQFADLLYRVNLSAAGDAYLYVLLEHKSYPDPLTAFQLLRYLVRIWERDVRAGEGLRPVVPVVLYHGQERWRAATDFAGLFRGDEALRPYWPSFTYTLQDLSTLSEADVRGAAQLQIGLLVLKYIFDPALRGRLPEILALFRGLAEAQTALEYLGTVLYYMGMASRHLERDEIVAVVKATLDDKGSEIMQTIAEQWINEGIEQGIERGIEQGIERGLQESILATLRIRFGDVSAELEAQVTAVTELQRLRQLHRQAVLAETITAFARSLVA